MKANQEASGTAGSFDIFPTSIPLIPKNAKWLNGMMWIPIFCANCGVDGGFVPEEHCDFAFYLCTDQQNGCATKWAPLTGTMLAPDEVFWMRVIEAQLERYGRQLSGAEIVELLKDSDNHLAKLARDRYSFPEYTRR